MSKNDLSDKQIENLQKILEYIDKNRTAHLPAFNVYRNVKKDLPDITQNEVRQLLKYLQLFEVGVYDEKGVFKAHTIALDSLLGKGGIRSDIENERQKTEKEAKKSEIDFQLKIKQLEDVTFRMETAETQIRNQNFYWKISALIASLALLTSLIALVLSLYSKNPK